MENEELVQKIAKAAEQYGFEKGVAIGRRRPLRNNIHVDSAKKEKEEAILEWENRNKVEK